MANLVNLTQHAIVILSSNGEEKERIAPSGQVARCSTEVEWLGEINDIPLYRTVFGEVVGLPKEKEATFYIVSGLVKAACPDREDLLVPGKQIRNEAGQVIGCEGLSV